MRKKLIILNIILILAAICLSYFGFKTANLQKMEMAEEIKKQTLTSGKTVSEIIGTALDDVEKDISGIPDILNGREKFNSDKILFAFDSKFNVIYPGFRTYRNELKIPGLSPDFLGKFNPIEEMEIKGDFETAAASYENLLKETESPNEKAILQFVLGRSLRKKGDIKGALSAYRELISQFPDSFSPDGLNLNIISHYEIIRLQEKSGGSKDAASDAVSLLQDMQNFKADISEEESVYFSKLLFDVIASLTTGKEGEKKNELEKLRDTVQKKNELREKSILVKNTLREKYPEGRQNGFCIKKLDNDILFFKTIEDEKYGKISGAELRLGNTMERDMTEKIQATGLFIDIVCWVTNKENEVIFQTDKIESISPTVSSSPPGWPDGTTLNLHNTKMKNLEDSSRKRMIMNIAMVGILFFIIMLSSILNLKMTMKEIELSKMKTNFISSVSHEIRLPLSTIKTANEMFVSGKVKDDSQARKYYEYIDSEVGRLEQLINNVLDFSRSDAGRKKYHFKEENLGNIVNESVGSVQALFEKEGFSIGKNIDGNIRARVDEKSVRQAVLNLLDNAKKYSGESRIIKVNLSRTDEYASLDITDNGIGIEKDKTDKIFDAFYRVEDEMTRKTKGVGLGLSIVKHIMDAHGGKVRVVSEKDKGSTFSLLFPLDFNNKKTFI